MSPGEAAVAVGFDLYVAVALEMIDSNGDGGWRDEEPEGQRTGLDGLPFRFSFEDGLEIVFFEDGDGGFHDGLRVFSPVQSSEHQRTG